MDAYSDPRWCKNGGDLHNYDLFIYEKDFDEYTNFNNIMNISKGIKTHWLCVWCGKEREDE